MAQRACFPAAALLVAALAVPASLHASALSGPRPGAPSQAGTALHSSLWSFDWFSRLVDQLWPLAGAGINDDGGGSGTDTGYGLDPSGHASSRRPGRHAAGASPDTGYGLDPSGGSAAHHSPLHPHGKR